MKNWTPFYTNQLLKVKFSFSRIKFPFVNAITSLTAQYDQEFKESYGLDNVPYSFYNRFFSEIFSGKYHVNAIILIYFKGNVFIYRRRLEPDSLERDIYLSHNKPINFA